MALDSEVSLGSDASFFAGLSENISRGGFFVATHLLREVGERVEFRVHLPDSRQGVHGTGIVRWVREYSASNATPPGMGIEFLELGAGAKEALGEVLRERL